MYTSQWKQDEILDQEIFNRKENGIFIDVGANDGILGSNSYFFEKVRNWTGICIEPIPSVFNKLKSNRTCHCIEACAYDSVGVVQFSHNKGATEMLSGVIQDYSIPHINRIHNEMNYYGGESEILNVPTVTLTDLCRQYNYNTIDFVSIDTEGSELKVLNGLNFYEISVQAIVFENNYPGSAEAYQIENLLSPFFRLYKQAGGDLIYVKK